MVIKKKYHCILTFFLLCCFFLIINLSSVNAQMSSEYLDYSIDLLRNNFQSSNNTMKNNYRNILNSVYNSPSSMENILNQINNFLTSHGLSNLNDRNIFVSIYDWNDYTFYLRFYFCNNTVPNGVENIANFILYHDNGNYGEIKAYEGSPDCIYLYEINLSGSSIPTGSFNTIYNNSSFSIFYNTSYTYSDNNTVLTLNNIACCGLPGGFAYRPLNSYNNLSSVILKDINGNYQIPTPEPEPEPEPETGGTGTITNNSGDKTGQIDLTGIENGITDLNNNIVEQGQNITNQISGDTQKVLDSLSIVPDMSQTEIDSQDITSNIDFGLITNNSTLSGYTNFWFTLTNGLRGALTGNVRSININFRGQTYTISLDNFSIQLPQQLKFILGMVSTIYFVILIVKWWKIIIDKITGGDIDEVLAMNEEERNYRFVLGGVFICLKDFLILLLTYFFGLLV